MAWKGEPVQVTLTPTGEPGCEALFPRSSLGSRSIHVFEGSPDFPLLVADGGGNVAGPFGYVGRDGSVHSGPPNLYGPYGAFEDGGFLAVSGTGPYSAMRVRPDGSVAWQRPLKAGIANLGPRGETVTPWTAVDGVHYSVFGADGVVQRADVPAGPPGTGYFSILFGSVDMLGNALLVSSNVARWFDGTGNLLAELPVADYGWQAEPLHGGGFALLNFLDTGGAGFTAILPSGSAAAVPPPKALADHPDARLAMLDTGGYALYESAFPYGPTRHGCTLHVWSLTSDFRVCGEIAFTAATGDCRDPALTVGSDGTVVRQSAEELCGGLDGHYGCTASARVWDRLLSASPAAGEPDATGIGETLPVFDEGAPEVKVETSGCSDLVASSPPVPRVTAAKSWPASPDPLSTSDGKLVLGQFGSDFQGGPVQWSWIQHYTIEKRDLAGAVAWGPVEVGAFQRSSCDACDPEHHVYAGGADASGPVLVYLDGMARWLDGAGNLATGWFAAPIRDDRWSSDIGFQALPKSGLVGRGNPDGQGSTWQWTFRPFETAPEPLPRWLAERPTTRLALVSQGGAIAAWLSGTQAATCDQPLEIVRDDAVCASVTFTSGKKACTLPGMVVEADGSVVRASVVQGVSGTDQPIVLRTWAGLIH